MEAGASLLCLIGDDILCCVFFTCPPHLWGGKIFYAQRIIQCAIFGIQTSVAQYGVSKVYSHLFIFIDVLCVIV